MLRAFTLVELAIVLVIIGLIVGGVLAGQELVKQASFRSVIGQLKQFDEAKSAFQAKFNALPGDLKNAVAVGVDRDASGAVNSCWAVTGNYNGDGNGILTDYAGAGTLQYSGEHKNFFFHLSNAGMIKEKPRNSGDIACQTTTAMQVGADYPKNPLGSGVLVGTHTDGKVYYMLGATPANYYITPSGYETSTNLFHDSARFDLLYPEESFAIDSKIDDSKPLTGTVRVISAMQPRSVTSVNDYYAFITDTADSATNCTYNAAYNVQFNNPRCTMIVQSQ